MRHIYLGAVAFGVTLLVASFVLGGKDTDHGGHGHAAEAGLRLGAGDVAAVLGVPSSRSAARLGSRSTLLELERGHRRGRRGRHRLD